MIAAAQGCLCVNLSRGPSELLYPQAMPGNLRNLSLPYPDPVGIDEILNREDALGYFAPTGRYWETPEHYDPAKLAELDVAWRRAWCEPHAAERAA